MTRTLVGRELLERRGKLRSAAGRPPVWRLAARWLPAPTAPVPLGRRKVPTAPALRVDPQLDDRPREHEPPDRGVLRQQRQDAYLGLQRLHLQRRLAAHARRSRERDVGEGDGKAGKKRQRRRPGHDEIAAGARLDVLDQPVAHAVDGCGHEDERGHAQQQAAEPKAAYPTMASQPVPCPPGRAWVRRVLAIGVRRSRSCRNPAHWVLTVPGALRSGNGCTASVAPELCHRRGRMRARRRHFFHAVVSRLRERQARRLQPGA